MKRRLTIARSLINEPTLLLLDEPTTGLDPQARHLLWDRLYRLKQRGVTLVLTTHYMDEAEQLCDRLVVMDKAKIVAEGSPRELIERYSTREVTELRFAPGIAGDARRPARRDRRAGRAPARPGPGLRRRRRGGRGRGPPARPQAGEGARPPVHARGRVPAADRPHPGRLGAAMTALAHQRSTVGRVCRAPLAALPADVPARASSARSCRRCCSCRRWASGSGPTCPPRPSTPRAACRTSRSSRRACSRRRAMQTAAFEATFPIMGGLVWSQVYQAMFATPITAARHRPGPARLDRRPADARSRTVFTLVMVALRRGRVAARVLAIPAAVLTGLAFAAPIAAFSATQKTPNEFNAIFRFGITPLFLFSGHVLPDRAAARAVIRPIAWLTPLVARRVTSVGAGARDRRCDDPALAAIHVAGPRPPASWPGRSPVI